MTKRERIEDLGKILVLSSYLLDHDLFNLYHGRPKDIDEWWKTKSKKEKSEFLYLIARNIQDISFKINDIWAIAQGEDEEI